MNGTDLLPVRVVRAVVCNGLNLDRDAVKAGHGLRDRTPSVRFVLGAQRDVQGYERRKGRPEKDSPSVAACAAGRCTTAASSAGSRRRSCSAARRLCRPYRAALRGCLACGAELGRQRDGREMERKNAEEARRAESGLRGRVTYNARKEFT